MRTLRPRCLDLPVPGGDMRKLYGAGEKGDGATEAAGAERIIRTAAAVGTLVGTTFPEMPRSSTFVLLPPCPDRRKCLGFTLVGASLSPVECLPWEPDVRCSNPLAPTTPLLTPIPRTRIPPHPLPPPQ